MGILKISIMLWYKSFSGNFPFDSYLYGEMEVGSKREIKKFNFIPVGSEWVNEKCYFDSTRL